MAGSYAVALNTLTHWPVDWTIIAVFAIIVALENIRSGAGRVYSLTLALPLAFLIFQSLPPAAVLGPLVQQLQTPLAQSGLFLGLVVVAYLFVYRIIGFYGGSSGSPLPSIIAGAAGAVVVLIFWLQVPALDSLWHFGPQVQAAFGEAYRLWWLIGAYLVLAFVRS